MNTSEINLLETLFGVPSGGVTILNPKYTQLLSGDTIKCIHKCIHEYKYFCNVFINKYFAIFAKVFKSEYEYTEKCIRIFINMNTNTPGLLIDSLLENKHSDACIYLPPYKLDVLKITYFNKVL